MYLIARAGKRDLVDQLGRSTGHQTCSFCLPQAMNLNHSNTIAITRTDRTDRTEQNADFVRQLKAGETRRDKRALRAKEAFSINQYASLPRMLRGVTSSDFSMSDFLGLVYRSGPCKAHVASSNQHA